MGARIATARDAESTASLFNPSFVILTGLFFFVSSATAAFFYLQPYLQSLGVAASWIGLIIGSDSVAGLLIQPLAAPYLHSGNGRKWMAVGLVVMALALVAYLVARGPLALLVIRIIQGAGFICFLSAMMAVVVSYIPESRSGQGFGFLSLVRLVPYALVPPVVAYLTSHSFSFPRVLVGFSILILVSMTALTFLKPSKDGKGPAQALPAKAIGITAAMAGLRDRTVLCLLAVNLLVYVCYAGLFFYVAGFGRATGLARADLFFTIATVMMVAVRLFGSNIPDRFDKFHCAALCLAVLAVSFALLPLAGNGGFYCLAGAFGLAWGVLLPLLNAMIFDTSSPSLRGVNLNLALTAMQGGFFLGPMGGGLALAASNYTIFFMFCALLTMGALVAVFAGRPRKEWST